MLHDVRLGRHVLIYMIEMGDWLRSFAAEMLHACGQSRDAHGHSKHRQTRPKQRGRASKTRHLTFSVSPAKRHVERTS